jgi:hypothetical protein
LAVGFAVIPIPVMTTSVGSGTVQQRHKVLGEVDAKDSVSKINLQMMLSLSIWYGIA